MNCPKCNGPLSKKNRCDRCGEDFSIYIKIYTASNAFYNDGLKKAKVRDLTGAVYSLKESLKLNKKNTVARNLLGLVYYEMGETVAALSEWVLSKHFQPENNDADEYMEAVQSNPTKLDTINQAIKKYNTALISAKQGNDDLAIIQLKKVINLNPRFLRALHLLALLYMKNNEKEKARKYLIRASKIDVTNTTTLRYLKELGEATATKDGNGQPTKEEVRERVLNETNSYRPISTYKEDKPNIMAYVSLIIGVVVGLAFGYFLLVPNIESKKAQEYTDKQRVYSEKLAEKESELTSLEKTNTELQETVDSLNKKVSDLEATEYDETLYDNLFEAAKLFVDGDKTAAAKKLIKVDEDKLERDSAKDLYNMIKDATFADMSSDLYQTGYSEYSAGKYEDASKTLLSAIKYDATNVDAMYFLARAYDRLGDKENAKKYYNKIIDKFPESGRATEAKSKLRAIE